VTESREAWLAARRLGIGASEVPAVLGLSPFTTPLRLFGEKVGVIEERAQTERMTLGHLLEPVVASLYAEETGRELRDPGPYTIQRNPAIPILFATLDREIVATPDARPHGVLEIKTTGYLFADQWAEEPPLHVQVQAQAQLAVTGHSWASIAVLVGGQTFLWSDLARNDAFIARMLAAVAAFWQRVEAREPPAPTGADLDTLRLLYPADRGVEIALPDEAMAWDATYTEARREVAKWQALVEEAEARIKAAMQDASVAVLPDGARYTWRTHTRREAAREARETAVRTFRRMKETTA
jgi:putative phage-type endonuclease